MAKTKKQKNTPAPTPTQPKQDEVAKELQDKIKALQALATCHNLLDKGLFTHSQAAQIPNCLNFLRNIHTDLMKEALAHPDALKVDLLKPYLTKVDEEQEQSNGKV